MSRTSEELQTLVGSIILEGNPANEIVDFAEKRDIDLIVLGSHGKTGIQRFLIGSVNGGKVFGLPGLRTCVLSYPVN
jgi:nucleotide-binding universal stress UspA family protein